MRHFLIILTSLALALIMLVEVAAYGSVNLNSWDMAEPRPEVSRVSHMELV